MALRLQAQAGIFMAMGLQAHAHWPIPSVPEMHGPKQLHKRLTEPLHAGNADPAPN